MFRSYNNLMAKEDKIQNILNILEMTIFLAMAQRKILRSPGPTAPFLPFYHVLKLLTLILETNLGTSFPHLFLSATPQGFLQLHVHSVIPCLRPLPMEPSPESLK